MYLTISSFYFRGVHFLESISNFLGLLHYVYALKNYLFLYACQLLFCNLYLYDSEKRQLFVKQLTLLAPSIFPIQIEFACPHVSNMYPDSL